MTTLFLTTAILGLYLVSLHNYLLFHSIVEIFSIIVACGIFMIAWNSRRFSRNNYLLFIGIAYLFVAGLDMLHTLGYKGMGIFAGNDTNLATQLWIVARYVESISLLLSPVFLVKKLKVNFTFLCYTAVISLLLLSIFHWNIFPHCFVEGVGLTPFKKNSEYVISLILLSSIFHLYKNRTGLATDVFQLFVISIVMTICSELSFTFYIHSYGISNLIGHFFKIISFYLIYKAIIENSLVKPYALFFRDLKLSNEHLMQEIAERGRAEEELKDRQKEIEKLNACLEKRVQGELEKSRRKDYLMIKQSRLAAMGEMLTYIIHQWGQPLYALNILLFNLKVLVHNTGIKDKRVDDCIGEGLQVVKEMFSTIDDFRDFAKTDKEKETFSINKSIKETLSLVGTGFQHSNISVIFSEKDEVFILGFPNEYSQALLNILKNAKDAIMANGVKGKITIDLLCENSSAVVRIKDNGGGIPENILDNIFDSYFTTKEDGRGTGIGLYMAKVIIEDHMDGLIGVKNTHNGTEFKITTPATLPRQMNQ